MAKVNKPNSSKILKITPRIQFGIDLARSIRQSVMPVFGIKQTNVPINKISKDFSYTVDKVSEKVVSQFFQKAWKSKKLYAYVTEDQGMVLPPGNKAEVTYLIDPVDGSRAAQIGAETACVNISASPAVKDPTFSDIEFGILLALKENLLYLAVKGQGVYEIKDNQIEKINQPRKVTLLKDASASLETYSLKMEFLGKVLDPLLSKIHHASSYTSASYKIFSTIRGQYEFSIDIRKRIAKDFPKLPYSTNSFPKLLYPMDVSAGWLMIKEIGGKVTDAYNKPLDNFKLWEFDKNGAWSSKNQISWISAITPELHKLAFTKIEEGFKKLHRSN